jgi:hypothetical protein
VRDELRDGGERAASGSTPHSHRKTISLAVMERRTNRTKRLGDESREAKKQKSARLLRMSNACTSRSCAGSSEGVPFAFSVATVRLVTSSEQNELLVKSGKNFSLLLPLKTDCRQSREAFLL